MTLFTLHKVGDDPVRDPYYGLYPCFCAFFSSLAPHNVIPKPILFALCLVGFIQYLISCLFMCLGLFNIIEPDVGWSDSTVQQPKHKALAALLIKEKLPVVRFEELAVDEKHNDCVVCLEEIQGQEEIRRLAFCRRVFHRDCLDRWIDHDQNTCPLCRTPLAGKMVRLLWL